MDTEQKIEANFQLLEKAVTLLLTQGVVEKRTSQAGKDLYFVSMVKRKNDSTMLLVENFKRMKVDLMH